MEKTNMKIKLQLPKPDGTNGGNKHYVCSICEKEFGCGKALGGHKRVHLPKMKFLNDQKLKQKNSSSQLVIVDQKLKCTVCDKSFAFKKSLNGHMGYRAKMNFRGIKLPISVAENQGSQLVVSESAPSETNNLINEVIPVAENQDYQLVVSESGPSETKDLVNEVNPGLVSNLSLPHWSRKGKRGKTSKVVVLVDPIDEAAEILMIENVVPEAGEKLPVKKRRFYLAESSNAGSNGGAPMHENLDKPLENKLGLVNPVVNNADIEIQIESENQYICDKSFKRSRALGGHRAYHPIKEREAKVIALTAFAYSGVKHVKKSREGSDSSVVKYQCQVCNKVFSTGQALGGHKCHCKGPTTENASVPFRGGENEMGNQRQVFMFDLNELPPPELMEQEMGEATLHQ